MAPKVNVNDIKLSSIKLFHSSVKIDEKYLTLKPDLAGYAFSFNTNSGINLTADLVRFKLGVFVQAKNQQEELLDIQGEFSIDFSFIIKDLQKFMTQNEDQVQLDIGLGSVLAGIAYSTARGIVLQQTQETFMGGVILPVISPKELLVKQ